jgi:flagellar motility protein MotE (MotC chaperone)
MPARFNFARLLTPRLLLTGTIFVAVLVMGARITDLWDAIRYGEQPAGVTQAVAESKDAKPADKLPADAAKTPETKPEENKHEEKPAARAEKPTAKIESTAAVGAPAVEVPSTKTPNQTAAPAVPLPTTRAPTADLGSLDMTASEVDVLKQLSVRRKQLDQREQELQQRGALIQVTEQRLDQKIKEMETLRAQLDKMMGQANEQRQAELDNLVRIYESMKPDEAARILVNLDMPILLGVIRSMKPARSALIMAAMPPDKAKDITMALTESHELPKLPE